MADPERTMLDRADVGPVVAPAGHSHEDLSQGLAGKADKTHADRHAAGGPDFVSPFSIDALGIPGAAGAVGNPQGQVTNNGAIGQAFDVDTWNQPGTWWVSGHITAANGFPWTPHAFGVLTNEWANGSGYMRQTVHTSQSDLNVVIWTRITRGGTWGSWEPVRVDTGWRILPLENGWTGTLKVRWINGVVYVTVQNLNGSAAINPNLANSLGGSAAFHAGANNPAMGVGNPSSSTAAPGSSDIGSIGMVGGTTNSILRASTPATGWTNGAASLSFAASLTHLPDPLPGTPG